MISSVNQDFPGPVNNKHKQLRALLRSRLITTITNKDVNHCVLARYEDPGDLVLHLRFQLMNFNIGSLSLPVKDNCTWLLETTMSF